MRIRNFALGLTAALTLTTGCAEPKDEADDTPAAGATSDAGATSAAPASDQPRGRPIEGISTCGLTETAPSYDESDLYGEWAFVSVTWVEDGDSYYTEVVGTLGLGPGGRWDGYKQLKLGMGGGTDPTYPGPGDWEYDESGITISYDDGSDSETYSGVLIAEVTDATGTVYKSMTMEQYDDADNCVQLLLHVEA